jgi:RNA polymerase sigma-70 factor, ECF subfamily
MLCSCSVKIFLRKNEHFTGTDGLSDGRGNMDSLVIEFCKQREVKGHERLRSVEAEDQAKAFALLVERQSRFLYRVAYSVLRNPHDAEDAVQETFLKLYRTDAWREMQEEKAYLARVVWRIAVERLPRREMVDGTDVVEKLASVGASPEAVALRSADEVQLRRLIDELPEELRQPLMLSALEEMNSREVGLVMRIPEGTVRTRLMRARAELRRRLEGLGARKELR